MVVGVNQCVLRRSGIHLWRDSQVKGNGTNIRIHDVYRKSLRWHVKFRLAARGWKWVYLLNEVAEFVSVTGGVEHVTRGYPAQQRDQTRTFV